MQIFDLACFWCQQPASSFPVAPWPKRSVLHLQGGCGGSLISGFSARHARSFDTLPPNFGFTSSMFCVHMANEDYFQITPVCLQNFH